MVMNRQRLWAQARLGALFLVVTSWKDLSEVEGGVTIRNMAFEKSYISLVGEFQEDQHHAEVKLPRTSGSSRPSSGALRDPSRTYHSPPPKKKKLTKLKNLLIKRESSGGTEWLGVWNCIFSGSEFSIFGARNLAKIVLRKFRDFAGNFGL